MSKTAFVIRLYPDTNKEFVAKLQDELVKNHCASDKEAWSGIMPENTYNPMCPDKSFKLYFSKFRPACDILWQRLDDENSWYYNIPVGQKTLAGFMTKIGKFTNNLYEPLYPSYRSYISDMKKKKLRWEMNYQDLSIGIIPLVLYQHQLNLLIKSIMESLGNAITSITSHQYQQIWLR